MVHPIVTQIFQRAMYSTKPEAILHVASILDGMGLRGYAKKLSAQASKIQMQGVGYGFGADIATIQAKLNEMGASPQLTVDGVSGPKTLAAIKSFQSSHGIEPDGIVGPITLGALGLGGIVSKGTAKGWADEEPAEQPGTATGIRITEDTTPVKTGKSDIATIQAKLNALGWKPPLAVDGIIGPKTKAAIEAFQSTQNIEPNAVLGQATVQALSTAAPTVTAPVQTTTVIKKTTVTPAAKVVSPSATGKPQTSMALVSSGAKLTSSPLFIPLAAAAGGAALLAVMSKKKGEPRNR